MSMNKNKNIKHKPKAHDKLKYWGQINASAWSTGSDI